MFTGIVECIGTIKEHQQMDTSESGGNGVSITIKDAAPILSDCHIGDSIAINGICLTVTEFDEDTFKVGISPETIRRTDVIQWAVNDKVNLERAVSQDVRFGGHYVQGHVDTTAKIQSCVPDGNSLIYEFKLEGDDVEYIKYIVEKGFICIDGTSLTITNVDDVKHTFKIAMIKHTQLNVVLPLKKIGDLVNIEVDLTGKIIEKQIVTTLSDQFKRNDSPMTQLLTKLIDQRIKEHLNK